MARAELGCGISRRVSDLVLSGSYLLEPRAAAGIVGRELTFLQLWEQSPCKHEVRDRPVFRKYSAYLHHRIIPLGLFCFSVTCFSALVI